VLRELFAQWGRPQQLRVDNGVPWGSHGDLPTDLVLWLAGLGVAVKANRPRRPQDNGVVERSQGTGKRWSEPATAADAVELQARLDRFDRLQREQYPYRRQPSRLAAHPELAHSGRAYCRAEEDAAWSLEQVQDLLTHYVVPRRVDCAGNVSVYNRNYYVGKAYTGQSVSVRYEPQQQAWQFLDADSHLRNQQPAPNLTRDHLLTLTVSRRRLRHSEQLNDAPRTRQLDDG
jgi:hypothetical protein